MATTSVDTAMITGAASGIGKEMTLRLAGQGVRVVAVDVNERALQELTLDNSTITPLVCDVADPEQVSETVLAAQEALGGIDRLVHCAALMPGGRLDETPTHEITRLMRVNYDGTVAMTKALLPGMQLRRKGQIVIFGSIAGYVYAERLGAYQATKAAVNAYAEVLAHELKGSGVSVLLVAPPLVRTPLIEQAIDSGPEAIRRTMRKGGGMAASEVVDAVDKALARGKTSVLPSEAKTYHLARRISPALTWWLIAKLG